MEEKVLTFDRQIAYHRNKYDYVAPPKNTLMFAYEDWRYPRMSNQVKNEEDVLKKKNLEQVNLDFRRGDNIRLALEKSDIYKELLAHFTNPDDEIRELSSRSFVRQPISPLGPDLPDRGRSRYHPWRGQLQGHCGADQRQGRQDP